VFGSRRILGAPWPSNRDSVLERDQDLRHTKVQIRPLLSTLQTQVDKGNVKFIRNRSYRYCTSMSSSFRERDQFGGGRSIPVSRQIRPGGRSFSQDESFHDVVCLWNSTVFHFRSKSTGGSSFMDSPSTCKPEQ